MSQENLEIVRRAFAAFEAGDLGRLRDLVTDDLLVYRAEPDGATSRGLDGFLQLTAEWTEGFSEWASVAQEYTDAGQQILVRVRQSARGQVSGVPISEDFWFVYEFRGARIARMSIYAHQDRAREAAGLSE